MCVKKVREKVIIERKVLGEKVFCQEKIYIKNISIVCLTWNHKPNT